MSRIQWCPALVAVVIATVVASEVQAQSSVEELRTQLKTEGFTDRLKEQRAALVQDLVAIAADDQADRELRQRAVEIIGAIRAKEAVPTLIKYIEKIHSDGIDELTIEGMFPCVPALIEIGKPSSEALLIDLRQPTTMIRRIALAVVLRDVEGRKVGRFLFQEEIAAAKTAQERENLEAARTVFLGMTADDRESHEPDRDSQENGSP